MSISKRGSNTSVSGNAPLDNKTSAGDQFHRFESGIGTTAHPVGRPGADDGIRVPTIKVLPAGDDSPSGGDGSLSGLGTWEAAHTVAVQGCSCAACMGMREGVDAENAGGKVGGVNPTDASPAGGNTGTVLPLGTNPDGSHYFTGIRNVDAILIGSMWTTTNLTYSFPTSGSNYNGSTSIYAGVSNYHMDLGPQQQAAARAAFAQLMAVTGLVFTEITETDSVHANIRISQTADTDVGSAYGGFPSDTQSAAGDIWFGRTSQPYYDLAFQGTWGFATMMHEIGHTMGLKHGHQDYTNLDLSGSFGTTPRFGTQSLTPDRDGQAWSLMTYTPAPFTNSNFAGEKMNQPQTYMQYDLAALQYLYGANFNTNNTDSVYTFSQTTGEMFINGVGQGTPAGNKIFLTIWDGGGNDTIDASNYANGVTIDLRPGEFSTVDQNQLANNLAYQNLVNLAPGNFAMSLLYNNDARSLIENAKGGIGNDIFVGNTANNLLDGGAGSDTVIFTNPTGVTVTLNDANTDVIVTHDGETDTLRSIENIQGTTGNDTLTGNSLDNTLSGGLGGTDVLTGNDGNDRLIGGGYTTVNNTIITKLQTTANTSTGTAVNPGALNAYTLVPDIYITNSTTVPHATINATAAGGGLEYYRLDVTAGTSGIFDIDFSGIDTWIEIVDSTGTTILANNDDSITDAGSSTGNSYLTFTFATAGTYYLRVGRWTQQTDTQAQALAAGTTYTLNISLSSATVNTAPFTVTNTSSATLDGGEGNDVLLGTMGNDTIIGGNGNDTASYQTAFTNGTTGVTVDLNTQGVAQNTGLGGTDTLTGIENLIGSAYNDTLTGDGNDNVIEGGLGNDTLIGNGGTDTASYANATAGVTVNLATATAQNTVNAGTDTLSGFENLLGSAFNDTLTGDANANTITGGAGNDILNPGGNAGGTIDLLDGGLGSDTASFAGVASGVTVTLNGATDVAAMIAGGTIATLRSIENLVGSANADILTGDANDNAIEGGLGNDTLDGGAGTNDTVVFTGSTAVTLNLATLTAQNTGWGSDTITNFENVRTGSGADNITGDGNDNIFYDGGGNDTYNGAGGIDTIDYSNITTTVTLALATTTAQTVSTGNSDTLSNIENVVGSLTAANTITGSTAANRITGGALADTIQGLAGNDVIFGGAGNDRLLGGTSGALDDGSADTLEGGAGSDFLGGGQGNDVLRGGEGDDTLVGGVVNTSNQYFTGVDGGDDTYDGGDGTDTAIMVYDGRIGVGASTVGIALDLRSLAGNSTITFNGVTVGSLTSIETLIFRGTNVNDTIGGTGSFDQLTGGAGDDVLDGWYGNDLLEGGLGDDTLIGGEGLDTATYLNATAGVTVDLRITGAQNTGGAGIDTLSSIEYLTGSAFGDTLRGNDDFNLIIDSGVGTGATALSQTDSLFGYAGMDSILVTRGTAAAAVATNINMDGGDGDDFIELRGGTLSVALAANAAGLSALGTTQGNVTYLAAGTTSSDRNVDVVTVDGGDGNDRIILTGVASATINAGSGADLVSISMRGATSVNNYQITLGSGADIIQLGVGQNAANSTDVAVTARTNRVTDFQVGDSGDQFELTNFLNFGLTGYTANSNAFASLHIRLVQSGSDLLLQSDRDGAGATNGFVTIFAISNGYTGGFTAFNFDGFIGNLTLTGIAALNETITGATGNDVLSGGDGNDVLIGLAGTDTLNGGTGDDVMTGGAGNDTLNGGGHTTYSYDSAVFSGNRSDYQVNFISPGVVQVIDLRAGTPDGTDTLTGIERLVFADNDYYVDPATGAVSANFPPIAIADVASATEDGAVVNGSVATNDADFDTGETATLSYALNAPVAGLSLAANGGYSFDPSNAAYQHLAAGITQTVVATYTVTDVNGASASSTLTITVTGVNDVASITGTATGAAAESGVNPGNTPFAGTPTVSGTLNISDADDGQSSFVPVNATGANGYGAFVVGSDGSWSYLLNNASPSVQALAQGQVVTDTVLVFSQDNSASQVITVTITGTNDVPVAAADTSSAAEDGAVAFGSVAGNDSDVDAGATRTWALAAPVAGLTLNSDGSYVFNPLHPAYQHLAEGATQTIVANYVVTDDFGATAVSTLTITVTGTNDAPVAANDVNSATEDGNVVTGNVGANDSDVDDGATRTYALAAPAPAGLTFNADGSYSFDPSNAAYQSLALGTTQVVTATYTVTDDHGATATATLTITVTGANDAPDAANDVATATEDGAVVTGNVGTNDTDVDTGATRTFALAAPVTGLTLNSDGSYSFDPSDAAYQSIADGATQVVVATYVVTDEHGATDTATLTITVTGVNDAPDATNDVATAVEDGAVVTGNVGTNDTDDAGDAQTYALSAPVAGLILNADGSYSFDPSDAAYQHLAQGATQVVTANYVVTDNNGGSDTATLTITVTGTNDAPDAGDDIIAATEDGAVVTGNLGGNDTDIDDGATRTYVLVTPVTGLSVSPTGAYSFDPSSYDSLAAGATLTLSASYRVIDDHGATDTATITITVTGVNDAPVAAADVATAVEDGAVVTGSVATNDSDVDAGATLSYSLAAPVAGLTLAADGGYSFDPSNAAYQHIAQGATQVVTANYVVSDGAGGSSTSTLTITVTGANDAPDAVNDVATATEDGAIVTGNVGANDTDVDDGATRTFALAAPVAGLTLNADGSYSFNPANAAYQSLAAGATQVVTANYVVTDQHGATDAATLTITVTGVDDAGVARNDAFAITESGTITGANLFADNGAGADSDVDSTLVIAAVNGLAGNVGTQITLASGALLTVNANGTFNYDPNGAFLSTPTPGSGATNTPGHDSFTYTLAGGGTATVNIVLTGLDTNDVLIGSAGTDILAGGLGNDTYYVQNTADIVLEAVGAGSDAVYTTVSYALGAGAEVEWLSTANNASTATIALVGNEFAQVLVGNAGANFLSGGGGADVMIGLGGNDTYFVDNAGDAAIEVAGGGFDAVYTDVSFALAASSEIEWLSASSNGATAAINLTGNELGQYILGNNGANVIDGRGGADFMQGFGGNDTYYVDNAGDAPIEGIGEGFDTVYTAISYQLPTGREIEWLSAISNSSNQVIDLVGNEFNQTLAGTNGANALDGSGGADTMIGYGGNDLYFADNSGDQAIEAVGGGFDAVYSSASFVLTAGSEVEWLSAAMASDTSAINLTGNEFGQYVLGNAGANVINGGGGADILFGYGGADSFQFTTALGAGNVDTIGDFVAGTDKIQLDDAIFTAIGGLGSLAAGAFVTGSAAGDADDRIIYNSATGQLFYDADGNGAGAAVLFATVQGNPVLSASDFQVI